METLILEEVLKVQEEALGLVSKPLDQSELRSLIHKIKGGALLSNDELLVNQCAQLEQSKASSESIQKSFYGYLKTSNQFLEKQIRKLKSEPSTQK
jgi:HPt (histidine-containing phosphotransfer) domain-containing protein